jgi:transposase
MTQAPKPEPRIIRHELTDCELAAVKPFLPNKPRGVPSVRDRRMLNGIHWVCVRHFFIESRVANYRGQFSQLARF